MKSLFKIIFLMLAVSAQTHATRVEVFAKGQQYWDVKKGESLSLICEQLNTENKGSRSSCQRDILNKNPEAFIESNPNRLITGKRLWLPGSYRPVSKLDNKNYDTQRFNWGSIKTPK